MKMEDGHDIFSSQFRNSVVGVTQLMKSPIEAISKSRPGTKGGGSRPGTRQKSREGSSSRGSFRGNDTVDNSTTTRQHNNDIRNKDGKTNGKRPMPRPKTMSSHDVQQIEKQKLHRHRVNSARHVTSSWIADNTVKKWERLRNKVSRVGT